MLMLDQTYMHHGQRVAWGRIGQGPAIVLVHGTPFSSQVWRRIAPLLARKRSVYFYDLLGYGQSEMRAGQDVSLGVQNGLLSALITHWNLVAPEILCHDFGGATVLRAYYLDGLRYRRVVMFDAVALAPWGSPFVRHVRQHESAFAGLPDYAHKALLNAYLQGAAYRTLEEEALMAYMSPWQGAAGQAAFYRQIAQMDQRFTDEIEHRYNPLDCPLTLLWGVEDQWIPIAQGERLADLLAGGRLERVPAAGHLMQDDAPESIIAAVLD
jgi:pimeloyl-ACP methyl ester carboxylesterase